MIVIITATITILTILCLKLSDFITKPIVNLIHISGQLDKISKNKLNNSQSNLNYSPIPV